MSKITPTEIVQWCRQQAALFNQFADMVDSTFKSGVAMPPSPQAIRDSKQNTATVGGVSVDALKATLRAKGMRIKNAAAHFSVPEDQIEALIRSPGSGLEVGSRGWIKETSL